MLNISIDNSRKSNESVNMASTQTKIERTQYIIYMKLVDWHICMAFISTSCSNLIYRCCLLTTFWSKNFVELIPKYIYYIIILYVYPPTSIKMHRVCVWLKAPSNKRVQKLRMLSILFQENMATGISWNMGIFLFLEVTSYIINFQHLLDWGSYMNINIIIKQIERFIHSGLAEMRMKLVDPSKTVNSVRLIIMFIIIH